MTTELKSIYATLILLLPPLASLADTSTGAHSLGDLATYTEARSGWPQSMTRAGDLIYFSADTAGSGRELWVSDRTPSGTRLVKDIFPGSVGSNPGQPMVAINRLVLFAADDKTGRNRLWISDGTEAGTRAVEDSINGPGLQVTEMVATRRYVYIAADDAVGYAVWRYSLSDGSLLQVSDTEPGSGNGNQRRFKLVADKVLFNTASGLHAITDGELLSFPFPSKDGESLAVTNAPFVRLDEYWYFHGRTTSTGSEVWRTDGTSENTRLLVDLNSGSASSNPVTMHVYHDKLYFVATDAAGKDLFVSDGTTVGTQRVRNVAPASQPRVTTSRKLPKAVLHLLALRNYEDDKASLAVNLCPNECFNENVKSGTPEPTHISSFPETIVGISVSNDTLYIMGRAAFGGYSLWRSDGTYAGTSPLEVLSSSGPDLSLAPPFEVAGSDLVIGYSDETGFEFWEIRDGKSIVPMREIYSGPKFGFQGTFLFEDDFVLFAGADEQSGVELWQTQGTSESTVQLANIAPDDSADSSISEIVDEGESFAFIGPGKTPGGSAIWRTDGSINGTRPLRSYEEVPWISGYNLSVSANSLRVINSGLTFAMVYPDEFFGDFELQGQWFVNGDEVEQIGKTPLLNSVQLHDELFARIDGDLWATNGEKGSVRKVAEITDSDYIPVWRSMSATTQHVWFFSHTKESGSAVWKSDGTAAGTVLAADINPDSYDPEFQPLTTIGENYFFLSADSDGIKLWRTGNSGTQLISALTHTWHWSDFLHFRWAHIGNKLVLDGQLNSINGKAFWVTDGTFEGTQQLDNVVGSFGNLAALNEYAYFASYDDIHGNTLWRSDGTNEGTGPVVDVEPGFDQFHIGSPVAHKGAIYFVAQTSKSGREIWRTDGETSVQVTELMPGSLDADPTGLKSVGSRLFFTAYVPGQGRELHVLDERE